jgi:hypothetical protein
MVATGYIRLNYTPIGGAATSIDLRVLSVKGLDTADNVDLFPAIVKDYLDQSCEMQNSGFIRKPTIDLGVIQDIASQIAILYWLCDNNRTVDYGTEQSIPAVPQSSDFQNEWVNDFSFQKRFILELDESFVRTDMV